MFGKRKDKQTESIALLEAAENGDIAVCRKLIKLGTNVNVRDDSGFSPLVLAAMNHHADICDLLLNAGAELDTTIRTCQGITLLHHAASGGLLRLCRSLVDAEAEVDTQTDFEYTPLHFAAMQGQADVCRLLLDHGATTDPVLPRAWWHDSKPLHSAAYAGHVEVVRILLNAGAKLDPIDTFNGDETPLHKALHEGHFEIARMLIHAGADVNLRDNGGNTPLLALLHYDMDYGVNGLMRGPREPFDPEKERERMRPNFESLYDENPVFRQLYPSKEEFVESNIQSMLETLSEPRPEYPFLGLDELYDLAKRLIDAGADVNQSSDNAPPIEILWEPGREKVRQLLVEAGAVLDPHRRAVDGRTPLHIAAMLRRMDFCRELLQLGAEVNALDNRGRTPWDYAPEPGCNPARYAEIAELLQSHGGKRTVPGEQK